MSMKKYDGPFKVHGPNTKWGLLVPIGSRFGHLSVQGLPFVAETSSQRKDGKRQTHTLIVLRCDCGQYTVAVAENALRGYHSSCGCKSHAKAHHITHGGSGTRLYSIWISMRDRCERKSGQSYRIYGQRGISVCQAWQNDFTIFRDWANATGYQDDLVIDRINPDGGYCPANCQWITAVDNSRKVWSDHKAKLSAAERLNDTLATCLIAVLGEVAL